MGIFLTILPSRQNGENMKRISVLGSTGSIGTQTLDVARIHKDVQVAALAVYNSIELLETQTREFMPRLVCVYDKDAAEDFKLRVRDLPVTVVSGMEGLIECALLEEIDLVVSAVVGMIGIKPVIEAIRAGKDIAFANKETLVSAGHLIMPLVKEKKVNFLTVDSEHSAIFQSLVGGGEVEKLILTASGGTFRGKNSRNLPMSAWRTLLNTRTGAWEEKLPSIPQPWLTRGLK